MAPALVLLLVRGESIYYVQRQLGHAMITLTSDLNGRWLPPGTPAGVDRLEDVGDAGDLSEVLANNGREGHL